MDLQSSLDMNSLQSDHAHSHCHLNGSSVALIVDNQSTLHTTSCESSCDFLLSTPTLPARSPQQPWQNKCLRTMVWEGPCPPQHTSIQKRETGLTLTFHVKTCLMNNNTAYQFYNGVTGSKSSHRCLVIPSGCKQGAHTLETDVS